MAQKNSNDVLKYSGMALQFAVLIGIGVYVGKQIDAYLHLEKSVFTALGALIMLVAGFYLVFKDILIPKK